MEIIQKELEIFNIAIKKALGEQDNRLSQSIADFVCAKSKLLRPKLIFLFAKAFNKEINDNIISLACAVELIHNATLIHDDIIDKAELRRSKKTLNSKFGNSLSVLSGDLLLSFAINFVSKCNNLPVFKTFADSMKIMCEGEINQYFEKNIIPNIDEYIKKSQNKTAELFRAALVSLCKLTEIDEKNINDFAINFGIAFQIKDDLLNIVPTDKSKPSFSDFENGIYTAPLIFLEEITPNISNLKLDELKDLIMENPIVIYKTKQLIEEYSNKAIKAIEFIEDNEYKKEIISITNGLKL